MNATEHNPLIETPNLAIETMPFSQPTSRAPQLGAFESLRLHWPEYLMEASLLGAFMVSACLFGALYEFPHSPVRHAIASQLLRRVLMGLSMGITAIAIIYSPWGKQSGAHINPSVTLTFLPFGQGQDLGRHLLYRRHNSRVPYSVLRSLLAFWARELADPAVRYVVTVPGDHGLWVALLAEFIIAFGMMSTVLYFSNHHRLDRYTGLVAGLLVATYITIEAPFSGMSMNPARTFRFRLFRPRSGTGSGSTLQRHHSPCSLLPRFYLWREGRLAVKCCKLHHNNDKRCIFCGANGGFAS